MIDPLLVRLISAAFGLLWLAAAWHKAADRTVFAGILADYRLLPEPLLAAAARALPYLEGALGLAWLLAFAPGVTALASTALLGVYALAITVNLLRGRTDIGCGCGFSVTTRSSADHTGLSWLLVLRNLALMALSMVVLAPVHERALGAGDYLVVAVALLAGLLLWTAAGQLRSNGTAMARRPAHE